MRKIINNDGRRCPTLGLVLKFDQFKGLLILLVVYKGGVTFLVNRALRMKVALGQGLKSTDNG